MAEINSSNPLQRASAFDRSADERTAQRAEVSLDSPAAALSTPLLRVTSLEKSKHRRQHADAPSLDRANVRVQELLRKADASEIQALDTLLQTVANGRSWYIIKTFQNDANLRLIAKHITNDQLKLFLENIKDIKNGEIPFSVLFLSKLQQTLSSIGRLDDQVIDELVPRFAALDLAQKQPLLAREIGSAFHAYMQVSPENFKKVLKVLRNADLNLWGYVVENVPQEGAKVPLAAQHMACKKCLSLFDEVKKRVTYIKNHYADIEKEKPLELVRLRSLSEWLLNHPEEVLDTILENMNDPLFIGLGEVFYLSNLLFANTNIKTGGVRVASQVHTLTSSEKVALVSWSTGYYNGINSALRFKDGVLDKAAVRAFNKAMAEYEKGKEREQTAPSLNTSSHRNLSEEAVSVFIKCLICGLKKLPDLSSTSSDGTKVQLKRVIFKPIASPWEEEHFVKGNRFKDHGLMSVSFGGTGGAGWRTLIFENISDEAQSFPGVKDITLFSIFGEKETEVVVLPEIEFDCLTYYDPTKVKGTNSYTLQFCTQRESKEENEMRDERRMDDLVDAFSSLTLCTRRASDSDAQSGQNQEKAVSLRRVKSLSDLEHAFAAMSLGTSESSDPTSSDEPVESLRASGSAPNLLREEPSIPLRKSGSAPSILEKPGDRSDHDEQSVQIPAIYSEFLLRRRAIEPRLLTTISEVKAKNLDWHVISKKLCDSIKSEFKSLDLLELSSSALDKCVTTLKNELKSLGAKDRDVRFYLINSGVILRPILERLDIIQRLLVDGINQSKEISAAERDCLNQLNALRKLEVIDREDMPTGKNLSAFIDQVDKVMKNKEYWRILQFAFKGTSEKPLTILRKLISFS